MLRPFDTATGKVKAFKELSVSERESLLVQMDDIWQLRLAQKKPIESKFAAEYIEIATGTAKAAVIPDEIRRVAPKAA